jgi:hypothetical protein
MIDKVNEGICRPEFAAQFFSRYQLPRPFKQCRQHLKRLFLELYLASPLAQFAGVKIDLERTETDGSGGGTD